MSTDNKILAVAYYKIKPLNVFKKEVHFFQPNRRSIKTEFIDKEVNMSFPSVDAFNELFNMAHDATPPDYVLDSVVVTYGDGINTIIDNKRNITSE